jgi:hypothetical protein
VQRPVEIASTHGRLYVQGCNLEGRNHEVREPGKRLMQRGGVAGRGGDAEAVLQAEHKHGAVVDGVARNQVQRKEAQHQGGCHLHLQVRGVLP